MLCMLRLQRSLPVCKSTSGRILMRPVLLMQSTIGIALLLHVLMVGPLGICPSM